MKKSFKNKVMAILVLFAVTISVLSVPTSSYAQNTKKVYKPVTITNYDSNGRARKVIFTKAPKRAITLNQATTEILLSLGLESSMVGTCYKDDVIMPSLQKAYNKVPVLSAKYPSKEIVLAKRADFLVGWKSAFYSKNLGETTTWDKMGAKTYISKSTATKQDKLGYAYEDILNIGKIFGVEDRANKVVKDMKTKVNNSIIKVKGANKVKVVVIDDINDNKFDSCGGACLENEMINYAGGINVFEKVNEPWGMSLENLVAMNPDVIVIHDWRGSSAGTPKEKIKKLKSNPALVGVKAIKNNRFVVVPLTEVYGGSIRTADGVVKMAKGFHPERFKK